jgi:adenosylcobinamide-phosphate synthase
MEPWLLLQPGVTVMAGAALVALGLDWLFGEPPARLHPVVAMGHYLGAVGRRVSRAAGARARPAREFLGGAMGWWAGAALLVAVAWVAAWAAQEGLPPLGQVALLGVLLKPMLSWRMLRDEVRAVETALAESLDAGRARVGWLVSRDVTALGGRVHPGREPQRLGRRAAVLVRRRRPARGGALPVCQHRRRHVGLPG